MSRCSRYSRVADLFDLGIESLAVLLDGPCCLTSNPPGTLPTFCS